MSQGSKKRLGFGDYQVRVSLGIRRRAAITLLNYCVIVFLNILRWLRNKIFSLGLFLRLVGFYVQKDILLEYITMTPESTKMQFEQIILNRIGMADEIK
jgi:hypothetical protein